jgi:hypothetical protein
MKKMSFLFVIMLLSTMSFGQQTNQPINVNLFAQCMFDIQDQQAMLDLEQEMRLNPNTDMVRLDFNTQRAFIITVDLQTLSENDFRSWFGAYASGVHCVQIGVRGVDVMDPYPFTNCQD